MKDFDYNHWLATAARLARRSNEAADLLHESLIDAIRAGRTDLARDENRRWFAGVLRNRAAMAARTAARRRRRETVAMAGLATSRANVATTMPPSAFIHSLPRAARSVATLLVCGLSKRDILAALRISDTSFRQRMTTIRRAWRKLPAADRGLDDASDDRPLANPELPLGLMRRALLDHVKRRGGVGTHDPDGHLIVLNSEPLTKPQAAATKTRGNKLQS